ncbi:MAG TPA: ABC transporter ATP-binding protein, partial [Albitalea sp.]|nr:ABC transporter ATP-binding protein [Albitalea sp.]
VLHNGQLVADGEPEAVIASPVVQNAYLGITTAEAA